MSRVLQYGKGNGATGKRREDRCRMGWTYVAFPADHLVAVVLASQSLERGFDDTATETEDEVEGRFLD